MISGRAEVGARYRPAARRTKLIRNTSSVRARWVQARTVTNAMIPHVHVEAAPNRIIDHYHRRRPQVVRHDAVNVKVSVQTRLKRAE